jgi:hypothetical protein
VPGDEGTKEVGRDPGYEVQQKLGLGDQLLAVEHPNSKEGYHPCHLLALMFSPQGSGTGDESSGPRGERQTLPRGPAPSPMPQSRSSEAAHGATLPTRGPELSAQEQMEGMLCRKQEMEAFNKKAANRYQPWLCCAEPVASRVSASEEGFLETS